ncbi:DinB family protein [Mucilaginibacter flavidus]|uniref:DinB family protein n=1 Tax=Mucilaginibacter flavidus TaxID=2949309 RepID=UPI0020926DCB|nr:DinB family protein [Mucilaginibacter flavidus]MCO5947567.1 DinB family protein [Mucilaginibacter flavidus]
MITDTTKQLKEVVNDILNRDTDAIDWATKPAQDKWSKKQIIGHLIDSAQVNLQRFVRCTYEENFKLTYEQVEWVDAQHYQDANVNELLGLWNLLNLQIIRVLENYPTHRLQAQCDNSKTEPSLHTVEWLASDYVAHMQHHLKQFN